jgi:hypothetical protein
MEVFTTMDDNVQSRFRFVFIYPRLGGQQGLCTGLFCAREGKLVGHHFYSSYEILFYISFPLCIYFRPSFSRNWNRSFCEICAC